MQPVEITEADKIKQEILQEHDRYTKVLVRFNGGMAGLKTDWEAACRGGEGVSASCRKFAGVAEGTSAANVIRRRSTLNEIEEYARTVRDRSGLLIEGLGQATDQIKDTETQLTNINNNMIGLCEKFEHAGGQPGSVVKLPNLAKDIEMLHTELMAIPVRRVAFEVLQDRCSDIYDELWNKMRDRDEESGEKNYSYRLDPDSAAIFSRFSAPIVDAIDRALDNVQNLGRQRPAAFLNGPEFVS